MTFSRAEPTAACVGLNGGWSKEPDMTYRVTKTDDEWRSELTVEQYAVLRQAGTGRAWTG